VYLLNDGVLKEANANFDVRFAPKIASNPTASSIKVCERRPLVKVVNVWFRYDEGPYVLKGVNLNIYEGEVLAVMGSNGSGKTTLMKHINGLLKPCKGRVLVCGRDTKESTAASLARLVGLAFQDPDRHLFADTVWNEVSFGCRVLGLPLENATRALKLLKLYSLKDRGIHELSMGEKVRVVIASALALDPKVLIMDEPTTGQDPELLVELAHLILKLKQINKSVVIVTHDSDFALEVADRVAVLVDGVIKWCDSPDKVLLNEEILREACLEPPSCLPRWCYAS